MNLYQEIRREVGIYQGPAVADGEALYSYPQLFAAVAGWSGQLARCGVGPDFRVGVEVENSADYLALSLAILKLEAVIVPISVQSSPDEVSELVDRIGVNLLLTQRTLPDSVELMGELDSEFRIRALRLPAPVSPVMLTEGDRAAFIRFSSGTTGGSKGVVLSHRTVLERTSACVGLRIGEGEAVLWVLDMAFHFVVTILLFLRRRALLVLCRAPLEQSMARELRRHRISLLYATPYHYRLLTRQEACPKELLASVQQAISTAMRLDRAEAEAFAAKFGFPLTQAYGIIEVGLPCLNSSVEPERLESVGRLQPAYRLELREPDAAGIGEICLAGPGLFDAYLSPFELRTARFPDGFFRTGDLGRLDAEGYLFISGRCKSVINFLGMKIFPDEVETVLNAHPAVRESRVSGRPEPGFGELPQAELVLNPGWNPGPELWRELRKYLLAHLPGYKVPKEFSTVSELPRTRSGKLIRH